MCHFVVMCGNLVETTGKDSVFISSTPARDVASPDKIITKSGGAEPGDHFDTPAPKHCPLFHSGNNSSSCLKFC